MMEKLNKAAVGGYAAPRLRGAKHTGRVRKIKTVDRDGNVIREIDSIELATGLLRRADVEFDVDDCVKKTHMTCACGVIFRVSSVYDRVPNNAKARCSACRSGNGQSVCAGRADGPCPFDRKPTIRDFLPLQVSRRNGGPWRCAACHRSTVGAKARETKIRKSTPPVHCAGTDVPCRRGEMSGPFDMSPDKVKSRDGRPWRCVACKSRLRDRGRKRSGQAGSRGNHVLRERSPGAPCPGCGEAFTESTMTKYCSMRCYQKQYRRARNTSSIR